MAQLYKMTLYVCDLEENLSIEEIQQLIDERALNGISTSCITHYAEVEIGQTIEWNDDVDLNKIGATAETWERYFQEDT